MNYIVENHRDYEPLRGDALEIAATSLKCNLEGIEKYALLDEEAVLYFQKLYSQIKIDLDPIGKSVIIETQSLNIEDAVKDFSSGCDIYCLGMPNETIKNLILKIRQNETKDDWTYYADNTVLAVMCNKIIEHSKILQEECRKHNVNFFDMSGNRKEKLKQVIEKIEKDTIKKV